MKEVLEDLKRKKITILLVSLQPPMAQTSHNFVEIREKLRLRLKEKEKKVSDEISAGRRRLFII